MSIAPFQGIDYPSLRKFIRNIDVIIHLPFFSIIDTLIGKKDRYIRNLFEVNTSGGCNDKNKRLQWENKIFANTLYEKFNAHDKVKYATLNTAKTKYGLRRLAEQYGTAYLVMKSTIRERCTITPRDSSYDSITKDDVATFQDMDHILKKFQNFSSISDILKYSDEKDFIYMEVQIHGELRFDRDVEKIMINSKYKQDFSGKLEKFFKSIDTKGIPVEYFDVPL
jgi:hypothetical protein